MAIKNDQPVIFKKTANKFFAENGIELQDAAMVIVKDGIYWMLKHTMYKGYKGRRIEEASYLPIVDVQEETTTAPVSAKEVFNSINFLSESAAFLFKSVSEEFNLLLSSSNTSTLEFNFL